MKAYDQNNIPMSRQHLQEPDGRVRNEGPCTEKRS